MRRSLTVLFTVLAFAIAPTIAAQVSTTEGGEGSTRQTESRTRALPDGYSAKDGNGNEAVISGGSGVVEYTGGYSTVNHQTKCIEIHNGRLSGVVNQSGTSLTVQGSNIAVVNDSPGATVTVTGDSNMTFANQPGTYSIHGPWTMVLINGTNATGSTIVVNGGSNQGTPIPGSGSIRYTGSLAGITLTTFGQYLITPTGS